MKPYSPAAKLVVRDSLDDEYSDDVEDDVFIRDGKSKQAEDKRPLMAPRRSASASAAAASSIRSANGLTTSTRKTSKPHAAVAEILKRHTRSSRSRRCWQPLCYACAALAILLAVIVFASVLLTLFPQPLQQLQVWVNNRTAEAAAAAAARAAAGPGSVMVAAGGAGAGAAGLFAGEEVPCTRMQAQQVWSSSFARLNSESPVRQMDVNGDGVADVVFGFGLDDSFEYDPASVPRCVDTGVAGAGDGFCEGGVLALDGRTGAELWRRWTAFNVFSLFCTADLNGDGREDCVAAGRGGLVVALNGGNGSVLWQLVDGGGDGGLAEPIIDLYTVNVVRDLNGDGVVEIVAVHVEERDAARTGHIKVISGRDGQVLRTSPSPFDEEIFVPVQLFVQFDGTEYLLITTGGQNSPGGVYLLRVATLARGATPEDYEPLWRREDSGIMVPPILCDITGDGTEDIVLASFSSQVRAFNGRTRELLWTRSFESSETVSSLIPGNYNSDNVTDFMVKYNTGPGFPVYYYSMTDVLDGSTGKSLLEAAILDAGGPYSLLGGVSMSQSVGGDWFVHWQTQCGQVPASNEAYSFVPDSEVVQQSRADTCRLRHNVSTVLNLHVFARHIQSPGAVVFSTDGMRLQVNRTGSDGGSGGMAAMSAGKSPIKHPKMQRVGQNKELVQRAEDNQATNVAGAGQVQFDPLILGQQQQQQQPLQPVLQPALQQQPIGFDISQRSRKVLDAEPPLQEARPLGDWAGDYESYFNFDQQGRIPFAMRPPYSAPSARDVRSKTNRRTGSDEPAANLPSTAKPVREVYDPVVMPPPMLPPLVEDPPASAPPQERGNYGAPRVEHRNTLWDLEMEREMNEAKKAQRGADVDFQTKHGVRRRRVLKGHRNTRQAAADDGSVSMSEFLPTVASTGVLLASLPVANGTQAQAGRAASSMDFVFVLNVRESEVTPPLLLPVDLECVKEKLQVEKATFGDFADLKLRMLEQKFLRLCIRSRLAASAPPHAAPPPTAAAHFESQIVVTRLRIECDCYADTLKDGEVCAQLRPLPQQRWTGFMGDSRNGVFRTEPF